MSDVLDPRLLLKGYAAGIFPMADSRDAPDIFWVEPRDRAVIPLDGFHLSRSLARTLKRDVFTVTRDKAFPDVLRACADRDETWINPTIERAVLGLFAAGHAHSIECWQDGELVGGLYGVKLGGAFFGESMFSTRRDASKVALAWLVARLKVGGFTLLDCQFMTEHLRSLGAIEVSRDDYLTLLSTALSAGSSTGSDAVSSASAPSFDALEAADLPARSGGASGPSGHSIAQLLTQTS